MLPAESGALDVVLTSCYAPTLGDGSSSRVDGWMATAQIRSPDRPLAMNKLPLLAQSQCRQSVDGRTQLYIGRSFDLLQPILRPVSHHVSTGPGVGRQPDL
jgi:hypothetical protein